MSRNERINHILALVARTGSLDVDEAATLVAVSAATIRRDFDELSHWAAAGFSDSGIG